MGGDKGCASWLLKSGARWSRDAHELVRQLVRVRARPGAPRPPGLCLGCLAPQVVGHAVGSGPARDRRDSAGRTVAAPQGGGRARTAPGSRFGAGGADRPQPPANALSMVLTARNTARCSGHKLFLRKKKKFSCRGFLCVKTLFMPFMPNKLAPHKAQGHRLYITLA